ncbi:MAG: VWA domain-containing protein [Myxococcales bacterium]|nr:VWA domain-containing protein [Myxococcales bacterium]
MVRFKGVVYAWVGFCLVGMASGGCQLGGGASAARAGGPAGSAGPAEGKAHEEVAASAPTSASAAPKGSSDGEEKSLQSASSTVNRSGPVGTRVRGLQGLRGAAGAGLAGETGRPAAKPDGAFWNRYDPPAAGVTPLAPTGAPRPARLDPNARYATTYRPGGAALVVFDTAVARGQVPAVYRDLLSDFGARYALPVARPDRGALAVAVTTDRAAVGARGGAIELGITLASSETAPPQAPLSVHLVLDRSGSMDGQAIEDAKHAAEAVVAKLDADDDFSLVTFSDYATLLAPDGRRAAPRGHRLRDRARSRRRGHETSPRGSTSRTSRRARPVSPRTRSAW